jgi:hypothetical protein
MLQESQTRPGVCESARHGRGLVGTRPPIGRKDWSRVARVKITRALKMAVMPWGVSKMLREEQEELARYGELMVPGQASVTLPEGKVVVSYRESIRPGVSGNERSPLARRLPWKLRSGRPEVASHWS